MNNQNIFNILAEQNNQKNFDFLQKPKSDQSNSIEIEAEEEGDGKNIFEMLAEKNNSQKENKFGFIDTLKDIGSQIVSKWISGIL